MNRTIKVLMISDIFLSTGFGLFEPFLAIFIKEDLVGGTIFAAGLSSSLFLITKSLIQLPFSRYVDKHDDKVRWLRIGTGIIALVPFIYMFATNVSAIYVAQILYGVGAGLAYPTWLGLWSTHLDKHRESFEWSLYSTGVGVGTAIAASIGAVSAEIAGFRFTFLAVGIMSLVSCLMLLRLVKLDKPAKTDSLQYHKRRKLAE